VIAAAFIQKLVQSVEILKFKHTKLSYEERGQSGLIGLEKNNNGKEKKSRQVYNTICLLFSFCLRYLFYGCNPTEMGTEEDQERIHMSSFTDVTSLSLRVRLSGASVQLSVHRIIQPEITEEDKHQLVPTTRSHTTKPIKHPHPPLPQ